MKRYLWWPLVGCLMIIGCATASRPALIFNGRNLDGWVVMHEGEWTMENGILIGRNGKNWTTNPEKSGSWLRTAREYGDFVLELDYAINEGGNSGIFFRSALDKNPAFTGYEIQILADHGRLPTKGSAGALYDVVAASKNMSKPAGEWNHLKLTVREQRAEVVLNGEKIVDHQLSRAGRGYIGLQNHDSHAVVKFRDVRLQRLGS